MRWNATLGALQVPGGTSFRVWAPTADSVTLEVESPALFSRPMHRETDGCFAIRCGDVTAGALYRYRVDGRGPFPDPASRAQPHGVHGPSRVVDQRAFEWSDGQWRGVPLGALVLYELHVGTFTAEGTFRAAAAKLPLLARLGVTAVELMPVADFPGDRNWGYDGVAPFAPARCYGTPDELRAFVDAAHRTGLAVHLDVVYNHFGPDGAYQGSYTPHYYSTRHSSPWGQGINYDGPESAGVRRYVVENALHWIHEYHIDGLRLDATHSIVDDSEPHIVAEIAAAVRESVPGRERGALVIAEDHRNLVSMIRPLREGGWDLHGLWSDDFHHQVRRALAGDDDGYFSDFDGTCEGIAETARRGWYYHGQNSAFFGGPRGSDPAGEGLSRFVFFIQNHDQVGNRACGDRLNHAIDPAAYRAASVLLLMLPETPLLFMGQEWAASSPFLYFTDHHHELGRAVTQGRRREFRRFARFADAASAAAIPDPQDAATFTSSRLKWDELSGDLHAGVWRLYERMLALRRDEPSMWQDVSSGDPFVSALDDDVVLVRRSAPGSRAVLAVVRLRGAGPVRMGDEHAPNGAWQQLLSTEDPDITRDSRTITVELPDLTIGFARPGALVLARAGEQG